MLPKKNIVLIGYRGAGKTSVAKKLSEQLGYPRISTDALIEKKVGNITEYVTSNGWDAFRKIEQEIIGSLDVHDSILDCGGGAIVAPQNVMHLKKNGILFWLLAPPSVIRTRLSQSHERPALSQNASALDEIEEVLAQRVPLYKKAAHYTINTKEKSPSGIACEIMERYFIETLPERTVISIAPKTTAQALKQLKKIQPAFPLIEIRIDALQDLSPLHLKKIIKTKNKSCHLIITNRASHEGGYFKGAENMRIAFLKMAAEYGADYIDVEYSSGKKAITALVKHNKKSCSICSYHNFKEMPKTISEIYQKLKNTGAGILKIACYGNSFDDNLRMLSLISHAKKENVALIGMIMGPYGNISRLAADHAGSPITTYAPLDEKSVTAPGQIPFGRFKKMYELLWRP